MHHLGQRRIGKLPGSEKIGLLNKKPGFVSPDCSLANAGQLATVFRNVFFADQSRIDIAIEVGG